MELHCRPKWYWEKALHVIEMAKVLSVDPGNEYARKQVIKAIYDFQAGAVEVAESEEKRRSGE